MIGKKSPGGERAEVRKIIPAIEMPSDRPALAYAPPTNEGSVWQQRFVWSLDVGENRIRILPPDSANGHVYAEILHHWGVGPESRGVICRRYFGRHCFICEVIEQLARSGSAADQKLADRMALNACHPPPGAIAERGECGWRLMEAYDDMT
jgi:hypothetical protein